MKLFGYVQIFFVPLQHKRFGYAISGTRADIE
jgi:hypothetical protein